MKPLWWHAVIILLAARADADLQDKMDVVRETVYGRVRGFVREIHPGLPVESFLGIPYAKPPIGELRFEEPSPPNSWVHEIRDAVRLPPACLQFSYNFHYIRRYRPGFGHSSEDCLYLNVHIPQKVGRDLPVMVYLHGGSNMAGMGAYFDGDTFTAFSKVILVTINYRIASLGFLGTGQPEFPGNYALLDQIMAFRWVQKNIAFFDGDPSKVTITGHSSGAFNVGLHVVSPLSIGLFRSAVCMSGSVMTPVSVRKFAKTGEDVVSKLASRFNCFSENMTAIKACLKIIPYSHIVQKFDAENEIYDGYRFPAVIDNYVLQDYPENLLKVGAINTKNIMAGVTKDEGFTFILSSDEMNHVRDFMVAHKMMNKDENAVLDSIRHEYTNWNDRNDMSIYSQTLGDGLFDAPLARTFDLLVQHPQSRLYMYRFEYFSELSDAQAATHGSDLFYLFGAPLSGHALHNFTAHDRFVSCMYISMFASFVRDGVPQVDNKCLPYANITSPIPVHLYSSRNRPYLAINLSESRLPQAALGWNYKPRKIAFWNELLPNLKKMSRCSEGDGRAANVSRPPVGRIMNFPRPDTHEKLYVILFGVFLAISVMLVFAFVISVFCRRKQTIVVTL